MINFYIVKVSGKNYNYFLSSCFKMNINIFDIKYYNDYVLFKISYSDYSIIKSIKTSCSISIIGTSGIKRFSFLFYKYRVSIFSFLFCFFLFLFLFSFTFFISIDTGNSSLSDLIYKELSINGITPFSFKKNYSSLSNIKDLIRNNNLDKIEWIEIYNKGVFTNVRVIERVNDSLQSSSSLTDVVASKNGYIKRINSSSGEIIKDIDDYIKKGEVIISGNIFRNDKVVSQVHASGDVFAEVWYIVKANKPYKYIQSYKNNTGYFRIIFNIFGKPITVFRIKTKLSSSSSFKVFNSDLFSISFSKSFKKYYKSSFYSDSLLYSSLYNRCKNSILSNLSDGEVILDEKTLKKYKKNDRMYVEIFFKTYENISVLRNIKKIDNNSLKE